MVPVWYINPAEMLKITFYFDFKTKKENYRIRIGGVLQVLYTSAEKLSSTTYLSSTVSAKSAPII